MSTSTTKFVVQQFGRVESYLLLNIYFIGGIVSYFLLFSVLNPLLSLFVLLFFWPILKPFKRGTTRPQFGDERLAKVGEGWNRKIPAGRPGGASSQSTEWGLFFCIVFTRISAAAFISFFAPQVRCLFKNWMPIILTVRFSICTEINRNIS